MAQDLPLSESVNQGAPALLDSTDTIFKHLDQQKGLASPVISAFAEDSEGFLWIGTQSGVARWDGYRMRTYQMEVGVAESLPDNIVKTLFTDSQGRVWVGTNAGGSAGYDRRLNRFTSYPEDPSTGNHGRLAAIAGDGGHGLWIGTDLGLDHFDPVTGQFTHFHHPSRRSGASLNGKRVTALLRESDGQLWVGTSGGLFVGDAKQETFVPVAVNTSGKSPAAVLSLLRDSTGLLWVGTLQGAFVIRNGDTMAHSVRETGTASPLDEQRVSSIIEAQKGVIWLGTYGQGIVAVNTEKMITHRIQHDIALPTSLSDDTVATLYRDRSGTVWAGTRRGANSSNASQVGIWTIFGGSSRKEGIAGADVLAALALKDGRTWLGMNDQGIDIFDASWVRQRKLRPGSALLKQTLPQGTVNALAEIPQGKVYIGTSRGLYRAERDGTDVSQVTLQSDSKPGMRTGRASNLEPNVSAVLYDAGSLWIGTDNGLWRLGAAQDSSVKRVILHGRLTDSRIIVLQRGQGDDLWVGTESGLNRVNLGTLEVEGITPEPQNPVGLTAGLITSMLFDDDARLWVATMGGGINVLEGRQKNGRPIFRRFAEGLPDVNVDKLLKAKDGTIWVPPTTALQPSTPGHLQYGHYN